MDWMNCLNEQQLQGVKQTQGAVLVVAGAGSGKTRVLTCRIAHLIEQGVSPYRILAITFTNKATKEMQERLETLCNGARGLWISTFHSFCARILRSHIDRLGYTKDFSIYDDVESGRLVKRIVKNKQLDEKLYVDKAIWHISNAKNKGLGPEKYIDSCADKNPDIICDIYEKYEEEMQRANALDYDDLLLKTIILFAQFPEVLRIYQERFEYIHIDEYQDTNHIQYLLVRMLASYHGNIFAVGDEDQSIYGWRGADINNILSFRKDFPDCTVIKLEQNYRSTGNILEAANALIAKNTTRFGKKLWTAEGKGAPLVIEDKSTDGEEADWVVREIASLLRSGEYQPRDIAILVRLNALTGKFEERLTSYNIPYKVFGGFKFFERKEIKDVLAYCRLLVNPRDNEALLRIINVPKRGIGDVVVSQLVSYASARSMAYSEVLFSGLEQSGLPATTIKKLAVFRDLYFDIFNRAQTLGVGDIFKTVVNQAGFGLMYAGEDEESYNKRLNIDQLVQFAEEYERDNPTSTLSDYLQSVTLSSDADEILEDNFLSVATVHAVKGLEFPVVFVVGLEENVFPSGVFSKSELEMEEERRVMYVAMTRAQKRLYLSHSATRFRFGRVESNAESRFLCEIKDALGYEKPRPATFKGRSSWTPQNIPDPNKNQVYTAQYSNQSGVKKAPVEVRVGTKVRHPKFGEGTVIIVNGENATVAFEAVGVKQLSLRFAPLEIV
ncbi:MAG: UvrD-helicase domain-containing protein [Clostridia bacterium]|nr:UvrD-helicase domain-containing protein [Clostridia bacterium]